jgi:glycerophosphoryl diester phosphodiesterase
MPQPHGFDSHNVSRRRIMVHGHRGARARRPENTLPAFEYAIGCGVDALEMDVAVTRDGVPVISHDPTLQPPVCNGPRPAAAIRQLTLAEVRLWDCGAVANPDFPKQLAIAGTRMPTLDAVFQLAPRGAFAFNVELKSFPRKPEYSPPPPEFARLVLQKVRQHKLERRVIVQSFDFRTLAAMRDLAPEIRLAALIEDDGRSFVEISAQAANAEIVAPDLHLVTPLQVEAAHDAGLQVISWTANTPAEWELLIEAGVDGIVSDDPARLIAYLHREPPSLECPLSL